VSATGWFLVSIGALLVGMAAGIVVGRMRRRPSRPDGPTVADLLHRVVTSSGSGIAVINPFGDVVLHNRRAADLGVMRGHRAEPRVLEAAERALAGDDPIDVDLSPTAALGRRLEAVAASVRPLGGGFTMVEAYDESETVRLEATRRDFVANVSHELKTPVGAIALLAEALDDCADDPEQVTRFSSKIHSEAIRLGRLVTELIALSRLQGAERLPELAVVDVDSLVGEALQRCRVAAERAEIDVTLDRPSGLLVDGDRTLLVTALSNLIDNAVAYSPHGSTVSVSRRCSAGAVEIAVTDRGPGIPRDMQERVFERFFRVDPARSRATGGTGLGLAIVKHVAANHGGEVRLWSSPGTGSTFTLRLPEHAQEPAGAGIPTPAAPVPVPVPGTMPVPASAVAGAQVSAGSSGRVAADSERGTQHADPGAHDGPAGEPGRTGGGGDPGDPGGDAAAGPRTASSGQLTGMARAGTGGAR
jgi:two-component system sensor histidine kinase SenX3